MKVLHVIPYVSKLYGGPVAVVDQMSKALTHLGIETDIVSTSAHGTSELDIGAGESIRRNINARYFIFAREGPRSWMFSWSLREWLYRNVDRYDVIHIHGVFSYTSLVACAAARFFHKPYVITAHGMLDPWCLAHKFWKKKPYYILFERFNLKRASAVHVTSSFEALGIAKLGLVSNSVIIPLSVSLPERFKLDFPEKRELSLLFLSRLDPIKGLPVLFQALASVRKNPTIKITLKVAGQGSDEYLSLLQSMAKEMEISEDVVFCGFQDGESKTRLFDQADIFVLPSHHENFSLATAEAMAAGLPVIVTDHVGISQEIADAAAGIVVPANSSAALADAIEKLADADFRRTAGENARTLVKVKFSEEKFGAALLHLYEEVLFNASVSKGSQKVL